MKMRKIITIYYKNRDIFERNNHTLLAIVLEYFKYNVLAAFYRVPVVFPVVEFFGLRVWRN